MYMGTLISDLEALTETLASKAISAKPVEVASDDMPKTPYAAWLLIADARMHIADQLNQGGWCCNDLLAAYHDLCWLQSKLLQEVTHKCRIPVQNWQQTEEWPCGKASVAFCVSCGTEICRGHLERKDRETLCFNCEAL